MKKKYTGSDLKIAFSAFFATEARRARSFRGNFSIISLFVFLFLIASCKKDNTEADPGYSYFPTDIGHWCIYEVDSTVYDPFNHDTTHYRYEVKELLQSTFTDNQGREAIRVERYKRPYIDTVPYDQLPWTLSRVWSFCRTSSTGEKVEENERFVRLTFVPRKGKKWNGNEFNSIGEWDYKYSSVDEPFSINSFSFDSTALVQQICDTNRLNYRWYRERYARHVGLIDKTVYDVSDTALAPTSVLTRIVSGKIYTIKLVDWGPQ
ncbi:MAG TPA: hypothetical protein VL651_08185 [Bacteroidia bacterium]|jgi:hypothetical protein|nr:hypothetical protein [Bacteroidia bacterium]